MLYQWVKLVRGKNSVGVVFYWWVLTIKCMQWCIGWDIVKIIISIVYNTFYVIIF